MNVVKHGSLCRETVPRQAHNLKTVGSTPTTANALFPWKETVDTRQIIDTIEALRRRVSHLSTKQAARFISVQPVLFPRSLATGYQ